MSDESESKVQLTNHIKCLHEKQYGIFDYIGGVMWNIWVNTYHWYYNTKTYQDYLLSIKFLKYWRENNPHHIISHLKNDTPK